MTTSLLRCGSVFALAAGFMTLGPTPAPAADPGQREALEAAGLSDAPPLAGQPAPGPRSALGAGVDLLLIPDSTADRVMAFDPTTGNLVDANFIPADVTNLSTPKHAFAHADSASVLVVDQIDDRVQRYDAGSGAYIGGFAPAGGVNTAVLDNAIAAAYRPGGGSLVVCVQSGANGNSVAEFDSTGAHVGNFIAIGSGGLAGPFDVYFRAADVLVSSINTDQILRYDLAGAFLGAFASVNNFPQQIAEAANGNILVANFGGTQEGVVELTSAGAFVAVYNPAGVGGNRGVYELPNGNILTTNGTGVYEISRAGALVDTKITGVSAQYIERVQGLTPVELLGFSVE